MTGVRQGLRGVRQHRLSVAAILLSLTCGIGLNAIAFGVLDKVILSPFPYPDADRLVVAWGTPSFSVRRGLNGRDVEEWAKLASAVSDLAAFQLTPFRFSLGRTAETMQGVVVGAHFFPTLGVPPLLGRVLSAADTRGVVLSHELWRSFLGSDPGIVGRSLSINGEPHEVVGVMPERFFFLDYQIRLWTLLDQRSEAYGQVQAIARMRGTVDVAQVRAELNAALQDKLPLDSRTGQRIGIGVFPLRQLAIAEHEQATWLLYGAVTLLLAGACANVSSVLLTRALERARDLATRAALGASQWDLARTIAAEAIVLSLVAGALSLLVASWAITALQQLHLVDIPRLQAVTLDQTVFGYTVAVSLACGLVSALIPTAVVARMNPSQVLRSADSETPSRGIGRLRELLLALEISAAVILLVGGGLLLRSFIRITSVDWGFSARNVAVAEVTLPWHFVGDASRQVAFTEQVLAEMGQLPIVESKAMAYGVPLRWDRWDLAHVGASTGVLDAGIWTVSHDYFNALRIPIRRGREFRSEDDPADRMAVINDLFASTMWPGVDPIGKQFHLLKPSDTLRQLARRDKAAARDRKMLTDPSSWTADGAPWTVVGEVSDVRMVSLQESSGPTIYLDYRSRDNSVAPRQSFIARSVERDPQLGAKLKASIARAYPDARVDSVLDYEEVLDRSVGGRGSRKLLTVVSLLLGGIGLSLAGIGVYALASLSVAQRLREIAVRRALGASTRTVISSVWMPQLRVVVLACLAGFAGSYALTRSLRNLLFNIPSTDVVTYAVSGAVVLLTACLGFAAPLWKAIRANPADLLRTE